MMIMGHLIDEEDCWPAPDDKYVSTCTECEKWFIGPKRAPTCYTCYEKRPRQLIFDFAM